MTMTKKQDISSKKKVDLQLGCLANKILQEKGQEVKPQNQELEFINESTITLGLFWIKQNLLLLMLLNVTSSG